MNTPSTPVDPLKGQYYTMPFSQEKTPRLPPMSIERQQWEEARRRGHPRNYENFRLAHSVNRMRTKLNTVFNKMNARSRRMNRLKTLTRRTRRAQRKRIDPTSSV